MLKLYQRSEELVRFVFTYLLLLQAVVVSKCPTGMNVVRCIVECNCYKINLCVQVNLSCPSSSCSMGYGGSDCHTNCFYNRFERSCTYKCFCMDDTGCSPITGVCGRAHCESSYKGMNCQLQCEDDKDPKAAKCQQNCHCENGIACDQYNKKCFEKWKSQRNRNNTDTEVQGKTKYIFTLYVPLGCVALLLIVIFCFYFVKKRWKKNRYEIPQEASQAVVSIQSQSFTPTPSTSNIKKKVVFTKHRILDYLTHHPPRHISKSLEIQAQRNSKNFLNDDLKADETKRRKSSESKHGSSSCDLTSLDSANESLAGMEMEAYI